LRYSGFQPVQGGDFSRALALFGNRKSATQRKIA
jgi:hypothetical protein